MLLVVLLEDMFWSKIASYHRRWLRLPSEHYRLTNQKRHSPSLPTQIRLLSSLFKRLPKHQHLPHFPDTFLIQHYEVRTQPAGATGARYLLLGVDIRDDLKSRRQVFIRFLELMQKWGLILHFSHIEPFLNSGFLREHAWPIKFIKFNDLITPRSRLTLFRDFSIRHF